MDNFMKTIPEMRHEVIDNTIKIELLLDSIIQVHMGFEPDYQETVNDIGEMDTLITNEKEIERFRKFFMDRFSLEKKFSIVKDIITGDQKKTVPSNLWENANKIRKIRNKFAHTLAPKYPLYKPGTIGICTSDFDGHSKHLDEWKKLYLEHTKLYEEVYETIKNLFYVWLDPKEVKK